MNLTINQPVRCSDCGGIIPVDAPGGHCPACLLQEMLPGFRLRYFGDYELLEEIDRGGMGVVFKARQVGLNRLVALKMILTGQLASDEEVRRFRTEAKAAANLDHPNIVPIYEVGEHEGRHYFTMKLVEGGSLASRMAEFQLPNGASLGSGRSDTHLARQRTIAKLLSQTARAVQYAHERGVLHRDLKPANILLDVHHQPYVTDFGLARKVDKTSGPSSVTRHAETVSGAILGSPDYMAPEQATGASGEVTTVTDVFSLGAILYHALAGRPPFKADTILATLRSVTDSEPPRLSSLNARVDRDLETICLKCLEKAPLRRYQSAGALADDLDRWLRGQPIEARPVSGRERAIKWARRHPLRAATAGAFALLALLAVTGITWQWRHAERQRVRAEAATSRAEATLTQMDLQRADDLFRADQSFPALMHLARVLRRHPSNSVAAERLVSALTLRNFPALVASVAKESGEITVAQFNANGRVILTASSEGKARLWNATNFQQIGKTMEHGGWIHAGAFSPDGTAVVTASADKTARVWSALTAEPVAAPLNHRDTVHCAAFSSDNQRVVTASADRTARVWDATTGQPLSPPIKHSGAVTAAAFSPDGRHIATGCWDKTARIWDAQSGQPITPPLLHDQLVFGIQFSDTPAAFGVNPRHVIPTRLLTASRDGTARLWDATTGEPMATPMRHPDPVYRAGFSPDGSLIVTASWDGTARLWSAQTGEPVGSPMRHRSRVHTAHFNSDGDTVVTASFDNTARVWDARTGQPLTEPMLHTAAVRDARFSPNGAHVLTGSADGHAQVWQISTRTNSETSVAADVNQRVLQHDGELVCTDFSRDGKLVITASLDGTARVWDSSTGEPLGAPLVHKAKIMFAQFAPDSRRVLTCSADATAVVWDADTGQKLAGPFQHETEICYASFSPDGELVATASLDNTARIWSARTGQPITPPLPHPHRVLCAEFSLDNKRLVTAGEDNAARIWNVATAKQFGGPLQHQSHVQRARFSPDGTAVVTAAYDSMARVWDANTGHPITPPLRHDTLVFDAVFSPDGRLVATASSDRTARVWDARTGQPLIPALRHDGSVSSVCFSPDGARVLTASADRTGRIWDATTGQPRSEPLRHNHRVVYARFSPDGQRVVTASADRTAIIWQTPNPPLPCPTWLPNLAESLAGARLNDQGIVEPLLPDPVPFVPQQLTATNSSDFWIQLARRFTPDR